MKDKDKEVVWDLAVFPTFGIKESPIMVEGLQTTIRGKTWQICEVKRNDKRGQHGTNVKEKFYLTTKCRSHLSFHYTIESAQQMAINGREEKRYD